MHKQKPTQEILEQLEGVLKHNNIKHEFTDCKQYVTIYSEDDSIFFATRYPSLIKMIEAFLGMQFPPFLEIGFYELGKYWEDFADEKEKYCNICNPQTVKTVICSEKDLKAIMNHPKDPFKK